MTAVADVCLPTEVLNEIFSKFGQDYKTLSELRLVNRTWASIIHPLVFRSLNITSSYELPPAEVTKVTRNLDLCIQRQPFDEVVTRTQQETTLPQLTYLNIIHPMLAQGIFHLPPITTFSSVTRLRIAVPPWDTFTLFKFACSFTRLEMLNITSLVPRKQLSYDPTSILSSMSLPPTFHTLWFSSTLLKYHGPSIIDWLVGPRNSSLQLRSLFVTKSCTDHTGYISQLLSRFQRTLDTFGFELYQFDGALNLGGLARLERLYLSLDGQQLSMLGGDSDSFWGPPPDLDTCMESMKGIVSTIPPSLERLYLSFASSRFDDVKHFCWPMVDETLTSERMRSFRQCSISHFPGGDITPMLLKYLPRCLERNLVQLTDERSAQFSLSGKTWEV